MKADKQEKVREIAEIAQAMVPLSGLWQYGALVPHLQIALYQEDVNQSIKQIKDLFDAARIPWNMSTLPLFYRIAQESFTFYYSFFTAFIHSVC